MVEFILVDFKAAFDVGITCSLGLCLHPHEAPLPEGCEVLLEGRMHPTPVIFSCLWYFVLSPSLFPVPQSPV